jgi:membrane-bound serine protease (ClpP class)
MDTIGTLLAALAVVLIAIDVFALAHGMVTRGGIAAFLIGSLALSEGSDPLLRLLRGLHH